MRLLADCNSVDVDVDCTVDDIAAGPTLLLIGLRLLFFLRILERREVEFKVHWNRHESNLAVAAVAFFPPSPAWQRVQPEEVRLIFFSPSLSMILASGVLSLNSLRMFARGPEEEEEEEVASATHRSGFPPSSIMLTFCANQAASCSHAGREGQG